MSKGGSEFADSRDRSTIKFLLVIAVCKDLRVMDEGFEKAGDAYVVCLYTHFFL